MFRFKTITYKVWPDGREEEVTHYIDHKTRSRAVAEFAACTADETLAFKDGVNYYDWVKLSVQDLESGDYIATATIM